jgi:hypothetical protein
MAKQNFLGLIDELKMIERGTARSCAEIQETGVKSIILIHESRELMMRVDAILERERQHK